VSNTSCFSSYKVGNYSSLAYVRFEVLIVVNMKSSILQDVILIVW
jgi:hypothetical protein